MKHSLWVTIIEITSYIKHNKMPGLANACLTGMLTFLGNALPVLSCVFTGKHSPNSLAVVLISHFNVKDPKNCHVFGCQGPQFTDVLIHERL